MSKILWALPMVSLMTFAGPAMGGATIELTDAEQTKLDKKLSGRAVGKARSCISRMDQKHMTVISDDVIVFGSSRNAKTLFVNKPRGGCSGAKRNTLVTIRQGGQLCKGEIVQVTDLTSGFHYGSCSFGEFVPYQR